MALVTKTVALIEELNPKYFFIENPRGVLRKLGLIPYERRTITYCRYGDTRMKPTDIWTNLNQWVPRQVCKNGNPDHERAPRGAKTGTQGLEKDKRGAIPPTLFYELFSYM